MENINKVEIRGVVTDAKSYFLKNGKKQVKAIVETPCPGEDKPAKHLVMVTQSDTILRWMIDSITKGTVIHVYGYLKTFPWWTIIMAENIRFTTELSPMTLTLKDGSEVKGFFTDARIIADGYDRGRFFRYDLRHSDDDDSVVAEVKTSVVVNHFGTFLTETLINGGDEGVEVEDWDFPDEGETVDAEI